MLFSLSDGDGVNRAGVRTKAHVQAFKGEPDVRTQRNSGADGRPPAAGDANASPSSSPAGSDVVPLFTSFVLQRAKVVINVSKCKVGVSLSVLKVSASLLFFFKWSVCRLCQPSRKSCQPSGNFCQPSCFSGCPARAGAAGMFPCREARKGRAPLGARPWKGKPDGRSVISLPLSCLGGCRCPAGWGARSGGP